MMPGEQDVGEGASGSSTGPLPAFGTVPSQILDLPVDLVDGPPEVDLHTCSPVVGEISGERPRFFEQHAHVPQIGKLRPRCSRLAPSIVSLQLSSGWSPWLGLSRRL